MIALLMADHRTVDELFRKFQECSAKAEKEKLAEEACRELITHTTLEEEIFYPACRKAGLEDLAMNEAQVEHDGAKVYRHRFSPIDEFVLREHTPTDR
jgi:hemerythrin superfamily protein